MDPRSILIIGNYGAGNLGDDAILGGILTDLKAIGYTGKITITHGGVKTSGEIYKGLKKVPFFPSGLRSRFKLDHKETYTALKEADMVILGGGGLFTDAESRKAPFIWAAQIQPVLKMKKPYICYGQSVGPLNSFWSRRLAKKVFQNARSIHVRDQSSSELLLSWKVQSTVGTDPAFSWLTEERRAIPKKPLMLIALRLWPGFSSKEWEPLLKELKTFAHKKKLKPILLALEPANAKEREALKDTKLEIFEPQSALQAFEGMEKATLAVSMRLHGNIFALSARTPFIALSYSKKVEAFFESLRIKGSAKLLKQDQVAPEQLRESLKSLNTSQAPQVDLEELITLNQAFLADALWRES